jgi:hypothetical protein
MKYIITESQYKLLSENSTFDKIKRRISKSYLSEFIEEAIEDFEQCSEFDDEYEYADGVIRRATSNFLYSLVGEVEFTHESFEESEEIIVDFCKNWFEDFLAEDFVNNCFEDQDY